MNTELEKLSEYVNSLLQAAKITAPMKGVEADVIAIVAQSRDTDGINTAVIGSTGNARKTSYLLAEALLELKGQALAEDYLN